MFFFSKITEIGSIPNAVSILYWQFTQRQLWYHEFAKREFVSLFWTENSNFSLHKRLIPKHSDEKQEKDLNEVRGALVDDHQ